MCSRATRVAEDQILADVMTDKATVEIPSPVAGKVIAHGGKVGQVMAVGSEVIRLEVEGEGNVKPGADSAPAAVPSAAPAACHSGQARAGSSGGAGTGPRGGAHACGGRRPLPPSPPPVAPPPRAVRRE